MSYFRPDADHIERSSKIIADIACALLILTFSIVFFGYVGGLLGFVIVESWLLGIDYLVPDPDGAPGTTVR